MGLLFSNLLGLGGSHVIVIALVLKFIKNFYYSSTLMQQMPDGIFFLNLTNQIVIAKHLSCSFAHIELVYSLLEGIRLFTLPGFPLNLCLLQ